jgi:Zn-dependent peptidase ImmA (M78 family)
MTTVQPEFTAQQLLAQANIIETPIPVEDLARNAGAALSFQPFESEDISGLLYRAPGATPIIGVNSNNPKVRQRFTIAHELGHLKLHEGAELIIERLVRVNFRDATSSTATDQEEIEANRFASELLMPAPLINRALKSVVANNILADTEIVRRLAQRFEVSQQAMEYRLANLGLLTLF